MLCLIDRLDCLKVVRTGLRACLARLVATFTDHSKSYLSVRWLETRWFSVSTFVCCCYSYCWSYVPPTRCTSHSRWYRLPDRTRYDPDSVSYHCVHPILFEPGSHDGLGTSISILSARLLSACVRPIGPSKVVDTHRMVSTRIAYVIQ